MAPSKTPEPLADIGFEGKGGKYLVLPPDFKEACLIATSGASRYLQHDDVHMPLIAAPCGKITSLASEGPFNFAMLNVPIPSAEEH